MNDSGILTPAAAGEHHGTGSGDIFFIDVPRWFLLENRSEGVAVVVYDGTASTG